MSRWPDPSIYQQIYVYLTTREAGIKLTAGIIARAIGRNQSVVRKNLRDLQEDGLVKMIKIGSKEIRPHYFVQLTGKCPHCGRK